MKNFGKHGKTVCILIDQRGEISYSNIDRDYAEEYLEDVHIFDHLPVNGAANYNDGQYTINVYKVNLNKEEYYLILIQLQEILYGYAYRDLLTGLYNRNYWEQMISGKVSRNMPKRFSLIIIDMDNLKFINDNKGHLVGDKAIRIVGQSIRESIRKHDIAIRYGGDEFFILLASIEKVLVEQIIRRIKEKIREKGKRENIHIEISSGTACSDCSSDLEKIISIADNKMYKEKDGKKLKARQITDELIELKRKIEEVQNELESKAIQNPKEIINKKLIEINTKLEQMIKSYSKYEK